MYATKNHPATRAQVGHMLSSVRYSVEAIEPERAATLLAALAEPCGGTAFDEKVAVYARSMAAKNWPLNGDPIVIDGDGRVADGKARLAACVAAGVPFPSIVFYGVSKEAVATLGTHLRRTPKDILGINGERYPQALATAWPVVVGYLNAPDRRAFRTNRHSGLGSNEIESLTERHPAIRRSAEVVRETGASRVLGVGAGTATHYLMGLVDPKLADAFMTAAGDPDSAPDTAPAALASRMAAHARTASTYRLALSAKAWNRFRQGKAIAVQALTYNGALERGPGGQEAFPTFEGVPEDARIDVAALALKEATRGLAETVVDASAEVVMETILVTPAMATEYLRLNGPVGGTGNRSIRRRHVDALARDMKSGAWLMNGKPLKFGKSGHLLDGQHRCSAAIQSGSSFYTFVVRNLDDAVFSTFDTGERKGFAQRLKADGVPRYTMVAATVAMLRRVMENTSSQPTVAEGYAYVENHPGLMDSIRRCDRKRIHALLQPSVASVLHYLFSKSSAEEAERFMTDLETGANLAQDDPLLVLREFLSDWARRSQHPLPDQIAKITIRAWNARRQGGKLHVQREVGYPEIA